MKKLLMILVLILLPLTASAAEVTITDYDGSKVRVQIPDADYKIMEKWNSMASALDFPPMKAIPYKGPIGFSIGEKASFHTLYIHQNKIELMINPETNTTEAQNYAQLLKQCVGNHIKITTKYMPSGPRSHQ